MGDYEEELAYKKDLKDRVKEQNELQAQLAQLREVLGEAVRMMEEGLDDYWREVEAKRIKAFLTRLHDLGIDTGEGDA